MLSLIRFSPASCSTARSGLVGVVRPLIMGWMVDIAANDYSSLFVLAPDTGINAMLCQLAAENDSLFVVIGHI
jgi:hypothetical protein